MDVHSFAPSSTEMKESKRILESFVHVWGRGSGQSSLPDLLITCEGCISYYTKAAFQHLNKLQLFHLWFLGCAVAESQVTPSMTQTYCSLSPLTSLHAGTLSAVEW